MYLAESKGKFKTINFDLGTSFDIEAINFEELYDLVQDFKMTRLGSSTRGTS